MRFQIQRYNPETDRKPYMKEYLLEDIQPGMMLRDALLKIKAMDESLSFRHSCGEGVCGSDAMNINGTNGLACLTPLSTLKEPIVVRPVPGMPIVRDLVVDMTQFFHHYRAVKPYLIVHDPMPEVELPQTPEQRDKLDGLYECILSVFFVDVAPRPVLLSGGIRINFAGQRPCYRLIDFWRTVAIRRRMSGCRNWMGRTACFVVTRS